MEQDLKRIKKVYGEAMSKFCREIFPTILEKEGLLPKLLEKHFEPSRFLYEDIIETKKVEEFKNYIYSLTEEKKELFVANKSPQELLGEAGYDLYECKTEKDIQSFKKYYASGEELCTFYGGRLNSCRVFFAVKKNVEEIKRENFQKPVRQDEYGTSVISIQFTKDNFHTLSIKNRYNHKVVNPDATYANNLDNIIPGLTKSFEKYYGIIQLNVNNGFEIPGYVYAADEKYYKYNYEIGNVYYCINNIIIDKYRPVHFDKEKYIILDYFILDLMNKKIYCYNELDYLVTKDCFVSTIGHISNIKITKHDEIKEIIITTKNQKEIVIKVDKYNRIIGYKNPELINIGNNFLHENTVLKELELPNVRTIGYDFCYNNSNLSIIDFPKLETVAEDFFRNNNIISYVFLPRLTAVGNDFLRSNFALSKLKLESLKYAGNGFLLGNVTLEELELPNLISVGNMFCYYNKSIKKLELLNLKKAGADFFSCNVMLSLLNLPEIESVGFKFFCQNNSVINLKLPKLKYAGSSFFFSNNVLESVELPRLESVDNHFLSFNNSLSKLVLKELKNVGTSFCCTNDTLKVLELPSLEKAGHSFCHNNNSLVTVDVRNLSETGNNFLCVNTTIQNIEIGNLKKPGQNFLKKHPTIGKNLKIRKMIVYKKINEIGNSILNKTTDIFKVESNSKK